MTARPPLRWLRLARLGAVLVVAAFLLAAWRLGVFAQVESPQRFADAVVALGAWGYVAFVVAYTLLQSFGVPGTIFVVAARLLWPCPIAFGLSMAGTMGASVVGFSFSRFVARDWVAARIPARLCKYDDALAQHAFRTTFLLRLILWMPQVLHGFLGVSRVPFWTHFWASLLGYVPPLLVVSDFARDVFDAAGHLQPRAFLILGALAAASLGLAAVLRRFRARAT